MAKKIKIKAKKQKSGDLETALRYYRSGDLRQAEIMCRQILQRQPDYSDAWYLMGLVAGQSRRYDDSIDFIGKAIHINPRVCFFYNDIGVSYRSAGRLNEAIKSFKAAVELKPEFAVAYDNLGAALQDMGRYSEAIENFKKAVSLKPDYSVAYGNLGNALREKGLLDEAMVNLRKALSLSPYDAVIHNNIGLVLIEKGQHDEAIKSLKKALSLKPDDAIACNNLGIALKKKGMFDEAIEHYKMALKLNPDYADAHYNLGITLKEKGMVDEAIENYEKALELKPDYLLAYSNLGIALKDKGMVDEAIEYYRKALMLKPDYVEAYNNLGLALAQKGMTDEAIGYYQKALILKPDFADTYINLGVALKKRGMVDEAIEHYRKALMLKPDCVEAYNNLGDALTDKGKIDEAIKNLEEALKLNPDNAEAYNNLGNALKEKGMLEESIGNYGKALALKHSYADAYNNLGLAFGDKGMVVQAIEHCKKAVLLEPNPDNNANLGMVYLLAKDFENGWREYEWRLKVIDVPSLIKPEWDGSSLQGKTILVYPEQGYGDTLQFVRYLPKLYEDFGAKKVIFIPQKGLEQILRESDLKAEILDSDTSPDALKYETNIHLLSLPRIFKTNLDNIPFRQKRYLEANPEKVEWYRSKFFTTPYPLHPQPFKIGIFWQGNPGLKPDRNRSMPLHYFYPLCRPPGVKIYSLQKGHGVEQLKDLPDDIDIVNLGDTFNDFSDTAAAIENLDLMITVDTAIGHLSGAMGKKTWILLPSHAEWRWHLDMDYSPWYEDVRLFRHKEPGKKNWEEMMERVVEELQGVGLRG
ncbi:MAG: tetratricopeptide repeat protein [Nitrospiraceae bacterium]|nr:MAG: tetratricopeptide repeat protein [Nitrospiraceae bacterium]